MIKTALTAATMGIAIIATPAIAGKVDQPTVSIPYKDLDLSTAEGQERLDSRIKSAARKICLMDDQRTGTRVKSNERKRCYNKALKSVESQMASIIGEKRRGG